MTTVALVTRGQVVVAARLLVPSSRKPLVLLVGHEMVRRFPARTLARVGGGMITALTFQVRESLSNSVGSVRTVLVISVTSTFTWLVPGGSEKPLTVNAGEVAPGTGMLLVNH